MTLLRLEAFLTYFVLLCMNIQDVVSTDDEASRSKADFYFAVDASVKISTTDFKKQLDFVNDVIGDLRIDQKSKRCALVTYGKEVRTEFTVFRNMKTQSEIAKAVSKSTQRVGVGGTDAALRRFLSMFAEHDKPGVPVTGIVFASHKSINKKATIEVAKTVRQEGIKMIVVGIGSEVDDQELKAIAGKDEFVFRVENYNSLESIRMALTKKVIDGKEEPEETQPTAPTILPTAEDCRLTQAGHEYAGPVSITRSGLTCQRWTSDQPHSNNYKNSTLFPEGNAAAAGNKCRNPESDYYDGVWCYTTDPRTRWELCDVPICDFASSRFPSTPPDCRLTQAGHEYAGSVSITRSGLTCQRWTSDQPHSNNYKNSTLFPEGNAAAAGNKCRNPESDYYDGVWCYTTDPRTRWELCDVPICDCRLTQAGHEYAGPANRTRSGLTCQRWTSDQPHSNNYKNSTLFPEGNAAAAGNKCRNPESDYYDGVWCYTTDPRTRWELCVVPFCSFASSLFPWTPQASTSSQTAPTQIPNWTPDCVKYPVDIVFVLDESGSITAPNFAKELRFVSEMVALMDVAKYGTRVGLLTFGTDPKTHFNLGSHTSVAEVQSAINTIVQRGGGTDTAKALRHVRKTAFDGNQPRSNARKVSVVITDGESNNPEETKHEAKLLKDAGVTVFAIGVGSAVNNVELVSIASDPSNQHLFTVDNFQALESIKRQLAESACQIPTDTEQVPVAVTTQTHTEAHVTHKSSDCKTRKPADIVFSLPSGLNEQDASHSLRFIATVAERLDMENGPIHIGLSDRPCHNVITGFSLAQGSSSEKVYDYILKLLPAGKIEQVATALQYLREVSFAEDQGARLRGTPKFAVAVLDRASTQITNQTVAQAKLFKSAGIRLMVIVVGKVKSAEHVEFRRLTGCSICILRVETYAEIDTLTDKLTSAINESLCNVAINTNDDNK